MSVLHPNPMPILQPTRGPLSLAIRQSYRRTLVYVVSVVTVSRVPETAATGSIWVM